MSIRPLDASRPKSSRSLGNFVVGGLATAGLLLVAAGLILAAFEAQGKPMTPYRASLVDPGVQALQAVRSAAVVYPDVVRGARVMPMVCPRHKVLAPFWRCV